MLHQLQARNLSLQFLFVGSLATLLVYLILTAKQNIDARGLSSGFDFLWRSTGWELSFSVLPFSSSDPYWLVFVIGILNTVLLGSICLFLATLIGLFIGAIRTSGNAMAELVGTTYVEIFRNVPLLLQLLLWYKVLVVLPPPRAAYSVADALLLSNRGVYAVALNVEKMVAIACLIALAAAVILSFRILLSRRSDATAPERKRRVAILWAAAVVFMVITVQLGRIPDTPLLNWPALKGLNVTGGVRLSPEFLACVIAITIYGSAYIAEIIRAGFNSIDSGITEAGKALGLSSLIIFFTIRVPLAIRAILPTLTNQYIWLLKATTLGIAVGFADFFLVVATSINQSGQTFEIMGIFMAGFLGLNYILAFTMNRVNASIALKGGQTMGAGPKPNFIRLIPRNLRELHRGYFSSTANSVLTIVFGLLAIWAVWRILDWAVLSAVWDSSKPEACRSADTGACWGVISARWRLIFFGLYPSAEQWRSALGCAVLVAVAIMSFIPRFWSARNIVGLWFAGFVAFFYLMRGGLFGLRAVTPQEWGGLALTLFIFASVVVLGMPIAVVLALLRRSRLWLVSRVVALLIDVIRSLPLLAVLYSAAIIVPLALPAWLESDKLYRVILAFAIFFACYQAEIFRSGFQAVPAGQEEAAKALGLKYKDRIFRVLLPQVFKMSLPPTINQIVITFKETSLVVIVGFFEIVASGAAAFGTTEWSIAYLEVYIFIGAIFFIFVFSLSRYGAFLERKMSPGSRT